METKKNFCVIHLNSLMFLYLPLSLFPPKLLAVSGSLPNFTTWGSITLMLHFSPSANWNHQLLSFCIVERVPFVSRGQNAPPHYFTVSKSWLPNEWLVSDAVRFGLTPPQDSRQTEATELSSWLTDGHLVLLPRDPQKGEGSVLLTFYPCSLSKLLLCIHCHACL